MEDNCLLCDQPLSSEDTTKLTEKGCQGLLKAATNRGDELNVHGGQHVHKECRRLYTEPKRISRKRKSNETSDDRCTLRSGGTVFTFSEDCLFCGKSIKDTKRQKGYTEFYPVRTIEFQHEISEKCRERHDSWAKTIMARIEYSRDLHASDALYHQSCSVKFRTGKDMEEHDESSKQRKRHTGRQRDPERELAFMKVVKYLEDNDEEQITVNSLIELMKGHLGDAKEPFTFPHMKAKLIEYFGKDLLFAEVNGKPNVVTFRSTASNILQHFYSLPKSEDPEIEKRKIIDTAAKLLKSDIKSVSTSKDIFPTSGDITAPEKCINYMPDSLQQLLKDLFVGKDTKAKQAAIGQAVMQAVRPRVMLAPLQVGLGIQLHHHFGSRFLIDTLNSLGFSCSYDEVQRYEYSAAIINNTEIPGYTPGQFVQFVADNVDHNIRTIDGHDTFHGMGIIASVTPGSKLSRTIPRLKASGADVDAVGKINLHYYSSQESVDLKFGPLKRAVCEDKTYNIDVLWKTTWLLRPVKTSWNGTMQMVHNSGTYPGQSSIVFMPMIDLDPSDETCIFSTLHFVNDQAKRYSVTPIITFDQPLWWKALHIVQREPSTSELRKFVLRLGGLHIEMSFLGCIGQIMSDSGLREVLETVYADNAVTHMLTGKAIARAVRGHNLVSMALQSLLVSEVFDVELDEKDCSEGKWVNSNEYDNVTSDSDGYTNDLSIQEQSSTVAESADSRIVETVELAAEGTDSENKQSVDSDIDCACQLFDRVLTGEIDVESACSASVIDRIQDRIDSYSSKLQEGRTGKLWLQYLAMIDILRAFIKAERTGDWKLHLQAVLDMLPYFASAGHNLYTKSAYVYLMNMQALETSNPDIYNFFLNGYHVIRRSDRFWAGLSTDLVIEQMLMRSLKTVGGLTRGRGMTDTQRTLWLLSRPACSEINEAMQNLTGNMYVTSEQHKESHSATQKRDMNDCKAMTEYLLQRNPFVGGDTELKSISSGVVANESNADDAKEVGEKVIEKMKGSSVSDFIFRKKDQVVTMDDKAALKVEGEPVKIDPQLLFQRLVTAAMGSVPEDDLTSLFSYELCTYPPALFESPHLFREADKPSLAGAMKTKVYPDSKLPGGHHKYVIDGGCLLQWLPWPRGHSYGQICAMYVEFVESKYGQATVVFDGYEGGPSTKDNTHQRRTGGHIGTEVKFSETMTLRGKKASFLANKKNKQRFIHLMSEKLQAAGIEVLHASTDADVLIVQTAVRYAATKTTVLVGDDTDLLVLMCYHVQMDSFSIYFSPRPKRNAKQNTVWDIHEAKRKLGEDVCCNILFLHAILGCDTTSKVFGFGKGGVFKLYDKSAEFRNAASVFNRKSGEVTKEEIVEAGESALLCLYKADTREGLDSLRVSKFTEKVAKSSSFVDPKELPPTSDAARYHSLRVYLQIQEWKGKEEGVDPTDWGWEIVGGVLKPLKTDKPPAPDSLMRVIRCTCKKGCKTKLCSCRKVGLVCSAACSTCKGVSCENAGRPHMDVD